MIQGLYGAATALDAASQAHDAIAHNLAHADMPGYKSRGVCFETFDRALSKHAGSSMGTQLGRTYTDFRAGAVHYTGADLDVALEGDSFFVMKGPQGSLYSRSGAFHRAADGQLQNASGVPLQGDNGPIVVPAGAAKVAIARDGTVRADNNAVGKIKLARFEDPSRLVPAGTTMFAAPAGVEEQEAKDAVLQGYREASNVQPATEMVAMIRNARYYEAAQRALKMISEAVQQSTRPQ